MYTLGDNRIGGVMVSGWIMMFNAAYKTISTGTMPVSFIG
jgi:hypothetical protein